MAEHVNDVLGAYRDGELHGWRQQQVEDHLAECRACANELETLRSLSALLRAEPVVGDLTPAERFAAQIVLQLPRQQERSLGSKVRKAGWWLAPATLLGTLAFTQTVLVVSWLVWAAGQAGMFGGATSWLGGTPQYNLWVHTALSLFAGSPAELHPVIGLAESWGHNFLLASIWVAALAGFYWAWLGLWWLRQQRSAIQVKA